MSVSPYAAAAPDQLDEIIRLAEARLAAQLTLGLAADQRAMTMTSVFAAIAAALIGLFAVLRSDATLDLTSLALLITGFGIATGLAAWSARPVDWEIPGNEPKAWLYDIRSGDNLHNGKAAMAGHYDEMIGCNAVHITANAKTMRLAFAAILVTLLVAGIGLIF